MQRNLWLILGGISLISILSFRSLQDQKTKLPEFLSNPTPWADSVLNTLSLEEQIAQLLMISVRPAQKDFSPVGLENTIKKYNVGGVIFFKGSPTNQAVLTNRFQALAKTPLMVGIDGEWGLGMRLDSVISYPYQMMLGAIQDNQLLHTMGKHIGKQCKRLGIHVNFAPVVDINNNPLNPVINYRSFGENKYNVANKGYLYMKGMQDENILTTAKHFPGHGDTDSDSHKTLPVIMHNRERLSNLEMFPFRNLIDQGLTGMMVAHLYIPALDTTSNTASTLSEKVVNDVLKEELGFNGLIFTDALNMKGVSKYHSPEKIVVEAFKAGNDILLMPKNVEKSIQAIKSAIDSGEIKSEEVRNRCHKILKSKEWVGLDHYQPVKIDSLYEDLNQTYYLDHKTNLIEAGITLFKNDRQTIPLKALDKYEIKSVSLGNKADIFASTLKLYTQSILHQHYKNLSVSSHENALNKVASDCNTVILSMHGNNSIKMNYGITASDIQFSEKLANQKDVVLVLFANPYILNQFTNLSKFKAVIVAYQDNEWTQRIVAQGIFGGHPITGVLPIDHPLKKKVNPTSKNRLSYGSSSSVGFIEDSLNYIDSIVHEALQENATPGCQVLVARKGKVVYNKSFGHHTYLRKREVKNSDVYDIASITKILSTVPAVLNMYDRGKMDLNKPISKYLPYLDTTNKKDLEIIDILTHQARLKPWIPFYMNTIELEDSTKETINRTCTPFYDIKLGSKAYTSSELKYKEGIFKAKPAPGYSTEVAKNLYILDQYRDTIFNLIAHSDLREKKEYKYSDLGYYLLYEAVRRMINTSFEEYLNELLFKPLGANIHYNAAKRIPLNTIVPTENDQVFRKQLLHGYVHDPGAAMLGGVCGHAGLFSNANDIAKIMQLYLNDGYYGYKQHFKPSNLYKFKLCQFCDETKNRRGIGFDKPNVPDGESLHVSNKASDDSFGHTGFTGTMAWADPKYDLIYVFLSNRVHPEQCNTRLLKMDIRTRIQDLIYNAILPE